LGKLELGNWWIWDDKTKNAYVAKKTITGTDIFAWVVGEVIIQYFA
jgi:hypothetical protein